MTLGCFRCHGPVTDAAVFCEACQPMTMIGGWRWKQRYWPWRWVSVWWRARRWYAIAGQTRLGCLRRLVRRNGSSS